MSPAARIVQRLNLAQAAQGIQSLLIAPHMDIDDGAIRSVHLAGLFGQIEQVQA